MYHVHIVNADRVWKDVFEDSWKKSEPLVQNQIVNSESESDHLSNRHLETQFPGWRGGSNCLVLDRAYPTPISRHDLKPVLKVSEN